MRVMHASPLATTLARCGNCTTVERPKLCAVVSANSRDVGIERALEDECGCRDGAGRAGGRRCGLPDAAHVELRVACEHREVRFCVRLHCKAIARETVPISSMQMREKSVFPRRVLWEDELGHAVVDGRLAALVADRRRHERQRLRIVERVDRDLGDPVAVEQDGHRRGPPRRTGSAR